MLSIEQENTYTYKKLIEKNRRVTEAIDPRNAKQ